MSLPSALTLVGALLLPASGWAAAQRFRIRTDRAGVYAVGFEALAAAGLPGEGLASSGLALSSAGRPVPMAVEDGGDGRFGPGDHLEFVAELLHGERSYYHQVANANVYWLTLQEGGARIVDVAVPAPEATAATLVHRLHLEEDRVMIRLSGRDQSGHDEPELWFWAKLTHLGPPLKLPLDLSGLATGGGGQLELTAAFRGLSDAPGTDERAPDHVVALSIAGHDLGQATWYGRRLAAFGGRPLPTASLTPGPAEMVLQVPRRPGPAPRQPIIDVVMLNWIEISYPHDGVARPGQTELFVDPSSLGSIELSAPAGAELAVYGDRGSRLRPARSPADPARVRLPRDAVAESFWLVEGPLLEPLTVEPDEPSDWRGVDHQADYLMIAHPRLLAETGRLANFHRSRGLTVAVADVQDLYDEFNEGVPDPRALREFITHARRAWHPPAPRFVLLVGDASWDAHNAVADAALYADSVDRQLLAPGPGFRARNMTPYTEGVAPNDRNLIPAIAYRSTAGQAATDDWYVADRIDQLEPALAIGRLPVTEPAELAAIVDKTIASASAAVGPWRRRVLWITNEDAAMQRFTDSAALQLAARGFVPTRVYPQPAEVSNAGHQQTILDSFAAGQALVEFVGHGGRFIWRTGPPDPFKNHDLFTLDHLNALAPSAALPVVVSLSCHTAPFDHPSADSIGEKFLRLPQRGALAVVAASWRTLPMLRLVEGFAAELTRPGTVGEALVRAKRSIAEPDWTAMYNLLGDPALPTPVPQQTVAIEVERGAPGDAVRLRATWPGAPLRGRVLVEWLDGQAKSLAHEERVIEGPAASFSLPALDGLRWASVYFWDETTGVDALGAFDLLVSSPAPTASP